MSALARRLKRKERTAELPGGSCNDCSCWLAQHTATGYCVVCKRRCVHAGWQQHGVDLVGAVRRRA